MTRLILGSASPRRKELVELLNIPFEIHPADISEVDLDGESARDHVQRLAREKAEAVAKKFPDAVVIGADTIVVLEESAPAAEILGKPADPAEAARMLELLSGRRHWVYTAIALCGIGKKISREKTVKTAVYFRNLDAAEIGSYIESGEPFDKAGAYGIQGLAGVFVERLEGSYLNVVGLPLVELREELKQTGLFWKKTRTSPST